MSGFSRLLLCVGGTCIGFLCLMNASAGFAQTASSPHASPFPGTYEFAWDNLEAMTQWEDVLRRERETAPLIAKCLESARDCSREDVSLWASMIHSLRPLPPMQKLLKVNQFINTLITTRESVGHPLSTNIIATPWQTSLEFLREPTILDNAAIAKYFALRESGFSRKDLRITVARDVLQNTHHMVLIALVDDEVYVLDTRSSSVLPHSVLSNYLLYYSFNETTRWAYVPMPRARVSSSNGQEAPRQ